MKYINKIALGLILCMGLATSCKDDEAELPIGISVSQEAIAVGPEGGTELITVSVNGSWTASASEPWIFISPANGLGTADCSLAIDSTLENTKRETQIRFLAEGMEPKVVSVVQFGYGKQIVVKEPAVEIESSAAYDKRSFESVISTNVYFKIGSVEYSFANEESMTEEEKAEFMSEKSGWLLTKDNKELEGTSFEDDLELDMKARPRTLKVRFRWNMNTVPYDRIAKIHLVPVKEDDQLVDDEGNEIEDVVLTVTQKAALKITDDRTGDSLAIVTINEKIQSMISFETSENMQNWDGVTLWEETDENLPEGAVGRVRSVMFTSFDLKDGEEFPKEIRYLKYLESLTLRTNTNWQIRGNVKLGNEICSLEHLKELSVYAYGITQLPEDFKKLGSHLEALGLMSNGFSKLSDIITTVDEKDYPGNEHKLNRKDFPKLTALSLTGCRRTDTLKDLQNIEEGKSGLHINLNNYSERRLFMELLSWDNLTELSLSYNFVEGTLPSDQEITDYLSTAKKWGESGEEEAMPTSYQEEDFYAGSEPTDDIYQDHISKDTCNWLLTTDNAVTYQYKVGDNVISSFDEVAGQDVPRVLPFARRVTFNLNFLTGELPKWVLFHPYFVEWNPGTLIFTQQEEGIDSNGAKVGFGNIDADKFDYDYYYGKTTPPDYTPGMPVTVPGVAYPLYYTRYVAN